MIMGSAAREADMDIMTQNGHADESMSPMVLLPPEIKTQILSYLTTQESISYLGQSCRAWHEVANEELYKRDSREKNSFAIKWMAAHAVDEQTTDSALRTLDISRQWGGQIDAVQPRRSWFYRATSNKDQIMYEASTAIHFAVSIGNVRLTKTLLLVLDMKASLEIPTLSLGSLISEPELPDGSSGPMKRVRYFQDVIPGYQSVWCPTFPIFIAFLRNDRDMCKLLIEHGAGREATLVNITTGAVAISILHFAAADRTMCYRQWRCLFDKFREYVDEPSPPTSIDPFGLRPLHIALKVGCTQGMEMAVEYGADKEARDSLSPTPMFIGFLEIFSKKHADRRPWRKRTMCFRKFVELGASVNAVSEGESVLVLALEHYVRHHLPAHNRDMRGLISFLLEQHADIHGTSVNSLRKTNVVNEIIKGITVYDHDQFLKELLSGLLDRGLNLTIPAPGSSSPLFHVLYRGRPKPEWLFDLLCENGAPIHEHEVDKAFLRWCEIPRLWMTNKYNAWWQHQGQEDKTFLKWCEHPYNAWWWQHVKHISHDAATQAYRAAFKHKDRQLYDILTHLPLPAPFDGLLVRVAFEAKQLWSWRLVVQREYEDDFLATWFDEGENMIHLTVRKYHAHSRYSAADAILDVLHLKDKGVNMSSRNRHGQTPLHLLLKLGTRKRRKDDFLELVALLKGNIGVPGVLETTMELRKMTLF